MVFLRLASLSILAAINRISRFRLIDEIKSALILVIGTMFIGAVFLFAWRLVAHIHEVPMIGAVLLAKLTALVFMIAFCMVVFSALVASFHSLFFNDDMRWLISLPVSLRTIMAFKTVATSVYSSWMVAMALLPFVVAVGIVYGAGAGYYFGALAAIVLFLAIASVIGIAAAGVLMYLFPGTKTRDVVLFFGLLVMVGLYMALRMMQPERLVRPDGLNTVVEYLNYLNAPTAALLPSWWSAAGVFALLAGSVKLYGGYLLLLVATWALCMGGLIEVFSRWYAQGVSGAGAYARHGTVPENRYQPSSPFWAFVRKDWTIFVRDSGQWSQVIILTSLIGIYLFSMARLPLDTFYLQNIVAFANIGLIGFIVAAVALRLVFPLISLEGRQWWIIASSPVQLPAVFFQKLIFGSVPVLVTGVVLSVWSGVLLKVSGEMMSITIIAVVLLSVTLSVLAMGFGAAFRRFDLANVVAIESSAGGIMYMITALFMTVVYCAVFALPVQNVYRAAFGMTPLGQQYMVLSYIAGVAVMVISSGVAVVLGMSSLLAGQVGRN